MKNNPYVDPVEKVIDDLLESVSDGDMTYGDILDISASNNSAYPEMLKMEVAMTRKLNELTKMIKTGKHVKESGGEVSKFELIAAEAMARRALRDLQKKIEQLEIILISFKEVIGDDLQVIARGEGDKPSVITYKGRHTHRLLEALKK